MRNFIIGTIAITLLFATISCQKPIAQNNYNVLSYGAVGDSVAYDNMAIQKAIDAAHANGGGTVYIPPGDYLIKPLTLKSNITLYLEKGATLHASDSFDHYPYVETRWEGMVCKGFMPILYANQQKNITIEGGGAINGNGKAWWDEQKRLLEIYNNNKNNFTYQNKWSKQMAELNKNCPQLQHRPNWHIMWLRPVTVQFYKCQNIAMQDINIYDAPFWTIHPVFTNNATFSRITINNPYYAYNTDGIDPESCNGVIISDCNFSNGDDCIAIKSGIDQDGRNYGVPCKNIVITGCIFSSRHSAIAIGSEMSGGVEDVLISDCILPDAGNGIIIKSKRSRGGYVKNIKYSNIYMKKIRYSAITVNMFYRGGHLEKNDSLTVNEGTPFLHHIYANNILIDSCATAIDVRGIPESPIHNVYFKDIAVHHAHDNSTTLEHTHTLSFKNVVVNKTPVLNH